MGLRKFSKFPIFNKISNSGPPKVRKFHTTRIASGCMWKYSNWREKWALERLSIVTWRWLMMFWMWDCYGVEKCKWNICLVENSSEYIQWTQITLNCSFLVQQRLSRTFFDKSRNYYWIQLARNTWVHSHLSPSGEMRMYLQIGLICFHARHSVLWQT